ncbi:MAG: phosphoglycerate dehydrogenase [Desulfovibrionaceae bacterium]|nr:phosphoglycerate dehydrogenase [Desulfovibrionaceae bacterium]
MKVLITPRSFGKSNPDLFAQIESLGFEIVRNDTGAILSEVAMCEKIADCEAVILGVDPCNEKVLASAPKLKVIARYGVGLDNVAMAECERRGITVTRTVGANSNAVADYAFALMLAVARKVVVIDGRCRKKDWGKETGIDIFGKTLGIVGLGAVGKCVARRAAGFGMKILASDPYFDKDFAARYDITPATVDEICAQADVITLHSLLNEDTRNLMNRERIASLKKNCILINTARGELVDEAALLEALAAKSIYGAGLDVFSKEPPADERWYELGNVVLGSHTSSSTVGTTNCMGQMCVDALKRAFGE